MHIYMYLNYAYNVWHGYSTTFILLPDPADVVEADGDEAGRKVLKQITWPLMDEDALPSSYIPRVLTCLSKWRVKLSNLMEVLSVADGNSKNATKMLFVYMLENCTCNLALSVFKLLFAILLYIGAHACKFIFSQG